MKNNDQRKAFIRDDSNWELVSNLTNVRTFGLTYKGFSAFRQESCRSGKWRKDCWYRFTGGGQTMKMDLRQFIKYLEEIDRRKPDQEANNAE